MDKKVIMNVRGVKKWLDTYGIENYTINEDLSVDVTGKVK